MDELQEGSPQQLLLVPTQRSAEGRVDPLEAAIAADDAEQVGRQGEETVVLTVDVVPIGMGAPGCGGQIAAPEPGGEPSEGGFAAGQQQVRYGAAQRGVSPQLAQQTAQPYPGPAARSAQQQRGHSQPDAGPERGLLSQGQETVDESAQRIEPDDRRILPVAHLGAEPSSVRNGQAVVP